MGKEQFEILRSRLKRILNGCGWTIHLRKKPSNWYLSGVKRSGGTLHRKYIGPLDRVGKMDTAKIRAILPDML
jgi:hypothetical protein